MEKEKKFRTGELGCETYENVRWCSSCGPGDWDWPDKTSFWKVSLKLLIMLDYIFQKAFRVVTIMVVMMSTMLTVILIREVELNLVTDGLDSIFHQPECSSWQAEYTEIGTENGESSLWSIITIVIIMVLTRVIIMVIINLTSRSSSWSSLWYLWSSSWLSLGTAWLTQNGHLVLEDGQHQVKNIVTL